ncbi:hypothetical protein BGZ59_006476 [Podila verticillata]|nr:hypothetical protein BGZ59_006476 [Podila verticillata]KAI9241832.1 MAG: hypothetical protein BYD32DRAFT_448380 [Podila humilis]KFH67890.1 hypothetical protein MVEG_06621 [Podila verticillata NRRL 6337]
MSYRGGLGRGGGGAGMQKPRGGGQGMNFQGDMHQQQQQQQQFGFQQRGFPPLMQQSQQINMAPQPIQVPPLQPGSRSFMAGMPSPSLVQGSSMPMVGGYQGGSKERTPFGPPVGPIDNGPKSHHDILRRHNEEYQMKQAGQMALSQAMSTTSGSYVAVPGRHNNSVVPVLPRLNNPIKE